ncbi:tetratricopeptide repeat protein [Nostoc linckia FACHB-104]|nr:tetratricopeptide repeat protein [Nostoc linckia FACHB-104]
MVLGILVSIPRKVAGQAQPLLSAQQSAELAVAERLNQQVEQMYQQGKYSEALPLAERALAIREKLLTKKHPDVANSLNNLALLYSSQGSYAKAEGLYLRSLAIREKVLGQQHPDVANSLNNLALLYYSQGSYAKAEGLYFRSLAILEKVLGKEHPLVAQSLNNLAELYRLQGNYTKAEPLLVRSLAIVEKVLNKEHPLMAQSLNNLALIYLSQGSYAKTEPLLVRSLAILEKVLGKEHPFVAQSLNNLAELYRLQGSYTKAEPLLVRSLAIVEKVLNKEHPLVAQSLNNLAALYLSQGSYTKAEPLLVRSLVIVERVVGREHPDVATSLNNLAELYRLQGSYAKAEPLYLRSLKIREKVLGKEHPDVATSLSNLALLYWAQGDINRTTDFFTRGLAVEEQNLQLIYAVGSEQRKQNYAQTFSYSTDISIFLALQQPTNNPTLAKLALSTIFHRKGRVLDAMTNTVQTLRTQLADNPETKKLFDDWLNVQQQLATLVYRGQGEVKFEVYQAQIKQLETEKERLEEQVSAKSAEFRQAIQPVELAAIQAQIPQNAAMVEIVQYKPVNPKAQQDSEQWGKPRYAAVVLRASGEPKWVDLGDATTIDKSVASFRQFFTYQPIDGKPPALLQKLARALDEQIMAPIRPLLGDARHLLLSPDGQLNLIPFEALKDEQNQYLVQRYAFSYLTTGRDLLSLQTTAKVASNPVIFAAIDYEQQDTTVAAKSRGSNQRSFDFDNLAFDPLTATLAEGQQIQNIIPQASLILGKQATEAAIKQLNAPKILHLATHGFFLPDKEIKLPSNDLNQQLEKAPALNLENPLLRSGLALAGFNNRQNKQKTDTDDGVLTALEVAGLNLRGTELVVLSACETGLGDVKIGGGVYGLRRALVIAGSQTQLLSLWQVADDGTKDLMVKYYEKLQAGKGRHEALREVQLELLNHPQYQHPYYWASFIPSGNWRAMK